jgi:hypothetical protein
MRSLREFFEGRASTESSGELETVERRRLRDPEEEISDGAGRENEPEAEEEGSEEEEETFVGDSEKAQRAARALARLVCEL